MCVALRGCGMELGRGAARAKWPSCIHALPVAPQAIVLALPGMMHVALPCIASRRPAHLMSLPRDVRDLPAARGTTSIFVIVMPSFLVAPEAVLLLPAPRGPIARAHGVEAQPPPSRQRRV